MESIPTKVIRILVGLLLVVAGLSKFFPMGPPPPHNEAATAFMTALVATGYMMPIIALVELLCGVCFVTGRFVALAAVLLVPISLNIVLFHTLLDPSGAAPGRTASRSAAPPARRLEDIPIEGEIAVPQVLFITARDQRRFVDFEHRRYLRTSLQVGETTRFPSWIAVIPSPLPEDIRKETIR